MNDTVELRHLTEGESWFFGASYLVWNILLVSVIGLAVTEVPDAASDAEGSMWLFMLVLSVPFILFGWLLWPWGYKTKREPSVPYQRIRHMKATIGLQAATNATFLAIFTNITSSTTDMPEFVSHVVIWVSMLILLCLYFFVPYWFQTRMETPLRTR